MKYSNSQIRDRFLEAFKNSLNLRGKRHFLDFHINMYTRAGLDLIDCLAKIDRKIPNAADKIMSGICSLEHSADLSEDQKRRQLEQIIQYIAEAVFLAAILSYNWPLDAAFHYEPVAPNGKRPELLIEMQYERFIFEVKAPSLIKHIGHRKERPFQLSARVAPGHMQSYKEIYGDITLPKDGPVIDFLRSAEQKFCSYTGPKKRYGYLVVLWDDFMYELTGPLVHPLSGLLTANSFLKDESGAREAFPSVDGVIAINKLGDIHQCLSEDWYSCKERSMRIDDRSSLNVFMANLGGSRPPTDLLNCLNAFDATGMKQEDFFSANYAPSDGIVWLSAAGSKASTELSGEDSPDLRKYEYRTFLEYVMSSTCLTTPKI